MKNVLMNAKHANPWSNMISPSYISTPLRYTTFHDRKKRMCFNKLYSIACMSVLVSFPQRPSSWYLRNLVDKISWSFVEYRVLYRVIFDFYLLDGMLTGAMTAFVIGQVFLCSDSEKSADCLVYYQTISKGFATLCWKTHRNWNVSGKQMTSWSSRMAPIANECKQSYLLIRTVSCHDQFIPNVLNVRSSLIHIAKLRK